MNEKLFTREAIAKLCREKRAQKQRVVFTNGCFDVLHAGHAQLLQGAKTRGDFLVVGLNSDASVRRLKGETRPINEENARAFLLAALQAVDAVCIFEEDTPEELIRAVRPDLHIKGGDYVADDLSEASAVREGGGEIEIVPLRDGFSSTDILKKMNQTNEKTPAVVVIPARFGAQRFPGKPLKMLNGKTVVERVARAALKSSADLVIVATEDARIESAIRGAFPNSGVGVAMTDGSCATGTERIAQAVKNLQASRSEYSRELIVVNAQGDEPFVDAAHIDLLIAVMRAEPSLKMATCATPLHDENQFRDPNFVKVILAKNGDALYFSRAPIPHQRDADDASTRAPVLRHMGLYAYRADWLLQMAQLPPTPLENCEKLEQLRALENGVSIRILEVEKASDIAIDTPQDLERAETFLREKGE